MSNTETNPYRSELIEEIKNILEVTPRRQLEAAFEPAVVLIQSESQSDNSRPPGKEYITSGEMRLLTIWPFRYQEKSRSPGDYYYEWDAFTGDPGLFMDAQGEFYRARMSGHGKFASFPAHPGDANVSIDVQYIPVDISLEELNDDDLESLSEALAEVLATADQKQR